ncbi:unnamed protein product [Pseudo-nitzschia multistriata]|uniref:Uncharacterized protein n=1 Tax=Pseudo-nitzschia multistriata TaxID=183589 RepID=A0A448ZMS5_9STRA|nr:unnamed protein product [Pseudo-nitzschia multistriata]
MEGATRNEEWETDAEQQARPFDLQDTMESMMRITFCGLGGTIVGLSLEKRLEAAKLTTAEGVAAAARRKRGRFASSTARQSSHPLSVTWAVSCMVFCSVLEASRLASPSALLAKQVGSACGTPVPLLGDDRKTAGSSAAIAVADYSIGGAVAGVICSFGRRMYARNSAMTLRGPRRLAGLLPGLALGMAAGTIQSAINYGAERLKESSRKNGSE